MLNYRVGIERLLYNNINNIVLIVNIFCSIPKYFIQAFPSSELIQPTVDALHPIPKIWFESSAYFMAGFRDGTTNN